MNQKMMKELKQFILETVVEHTAGLHQGLADLRNDVTKINKDMEKLTENVREVRMAIGRLDLNQQLLEKKVDNLAGFVSDILTTSNEVNEKRFEEHYHRLSKLEQTPP